MNFNELWNLLYQHGASAKKEEGTRRFWNTLTPQQQSHAFTTISNRLGASAHDARKQVADKHGIPPERVQNSITWFFHEAQKRRKYDFLEKFFNIDGTLK